jgi:hypothetical protein
LLAAPAYANADSTSVWEGRVRAGGIVKDETGDRTTTQETFNVYEGFSVSSLYLRGRFNPLTHLRFDATDINLDDRRGTLDFRRTGLLNLRARYDQSRFLFDPDGAISAARKDLSSTLSITPSRWLWVSGDYGFQQRQGDRIGYPAGVSGILGNAYDSQLHRYRAEIQARSGGGIGGTVAYEHARLDDDLDARNQRDGHVYSAIVRVPGLIYDRLTHVVRGAIGRSELPEAGVGYDLATFQYTGVIAPWRSLRGKYQFYGSSIDDDALDNQTDRYIHDGEIEARYRAAMVSVGYAWEAWDDDRSVTTYDNLRAAAGVGRSTDAVSARVSWSARNKDDEEDLTLLRDTEYVRWDGRIDGRLPGSLIAGGRAAERTRKMPDIGSEASGFTASAYGGYDYEHFGDAGVVSGRLRVDYVYADDDFDNRTDDYHVTSHTVIARVDADYHETISGAVAVTYLSLGEDIDVDKSLLSFELGYHFGKGFSADAKYNIYNYDDYLVASRFYTANVAWINLGYAFSTE